MHRDKPNGGHGIKLLLAADNAVGDDYRDVLRNSATEYFPGLNPAGCAANTCAPPQAYVLVVGGDDGVRADNLVSRSCHVSSV
jgi:hypothetical protein